METKTLIPLVGLKVCLEGVIRLLDKIKEYVMNMLGSIPHQKFCFYHLPTRARVGIKLGDADTSPTYL